MNIHPSQRKKNSDIDSLVLALGPLFESIKKNRINKRNFDGFESVHYPDFKYDEGMLIGGYFFSKDIYLPGNGGDLLAVYSHYNLRLQDFMDLVVQMLDCQKIAIDTRVLSVKEEVYKKPHPDGILNVSLSELTLKGKIYFHENTFRFDAKEKRINHLDSWQSNEQEEMIERINIRVLEYLK